MQHKTNGMSVKIYKTNLFVFSKNWNTSNIINNENILM